MLKKSNFYLVGIALILPMTLSLTWITLLVIGSMLIFSTSLYFNLWACFLSGVAAVGFMGLKPFGKGSLGQRVGYFSLHSLTVFLVLQLFSFAEPVRGLNNSSMLFSQTVALSWVLCMVWSVESCVKRIKLQSLNRYLCEVIFINMLKIVGIIFFLLIVILPFYVMLISSLKNQQELLLNPLDFSIEISKGWEVLRSYRELFSQFHFFTFLTNSFIVSVLTVLLTLSFSIPGAYAVARLRFKSQALFSRSILLIYMVPAIILVIPLYALFSAWGLRDTFYGLLIVYPATTIPVALYMLQGYFKSIPMELEEAGLIDGLSRFGVVRKITLPLSLPALASVSLYVFMISWNEFLFAFMFIDSVDIFTLSRGIVSLNSSEVPRQFLMAGAVIATIPVLLLFLVFEKFLVSGLTTGSVKG